MKSVKAPCHATIQHRDSEDCGGTVHCDNLRLRQSFELAVWRDRASGVLCGAFEMQTGIIIRVYSSGGMRPGV